MALPAERRETGDTPRPGVPPTLLVLLSVVSVQIGATIATHLFASIGPGGAVFLRIGFAAPILLLLWRPRLSGYTARDWLAVLLFGISLAAMNFSFYSALARIPLGVAVTVEFVGPLGVALAGSRRALDAVWGLLAATGILLLSPLHATHLDSLGVLLALLAGVFWAAYIVLSARVGRAFPGGAGLALSLSVGTLLLLPIGLRAPLADGRVLLMGLGVALLSSVIPYSMDLEALRYLPARVFGILVSLDPVAAALAGLLILHQALGLSAAIAIACVTIASIGASYTGKTTPTEVAP